MKKYLPKIKEMCESNGFKFIDNGDEYVIIENINNEIEYLHKEFFITILSNKGEL